MRPPNVFIAHHAEDVPADDGYVPLRYGRLAEDLVARGSHVVRVSPTFSHFRRAQRDPGTLQSAEGEHVLIPTTGYDSSFDPKRLLFFAQLVKGAVTEIRARRDAIDVAVLGVPPPTMVGAVRSATRSSIPIIADVRDLWPEAFAVGRPRLMPTAEVAGRMLSQELGLASAITAVTATMLDWAPETKKPRMVIPIGLRPRTLDVDARPNPGSPLQVCFLSNHSHGYDFVPVLTAWRDYVGSLGDRGSQARLAFIGVEPSGDEAQRLAAEQETVEYLGRVSPEDLTTILSGFDVGLAPATPEWEVSVGNKVFDYLSAGLFMIHSVSPRETDVMDAKGLSKRCELDLASWTAAFTRFDEGELVRLRTSRQERIALADQLYGRTATSQTFIDLIDDLAGQQPD